MDPDIYGLTMS